METKEYLKWNDNRVLWSGGEYNFTWGDVSILKEVETAINGGGGIGMMPDIDPFEWIEKKVDTKVAEKFKKIVIRVNGLEKTKNQNNEIKVTAEHVRNTLKKFSVKIN